MSQLTDIPQRAGWQTQIYGFLISFLMVLYITYCCYCACSGEKWCSHSHHCILSVFHNLFRTQYYQLQHLVLLFCNFYSCVLYSPEPTPPSIQTIILFDDFYECCSTWNYVLLVSHLLCTLLNLQQNEHLVIIFYYLWIVGGYTSCSASHRTDSDFSLSLMIEFC